VAEERTDPDVKVVDRRWWARGESAAPADDSALRKPTVVEDLEQRLGEAAAQLQHVLSEHRRAAEEFDQVKARMRRDLAREVERGRRAVLVEMLEVVDNLDRAIDAARANEGAEAAGTLLRGVELVRDQFLAKLEAFGVSRVPALGTAFDPLRHEAVSMSPVTDPARAGQVVGIVKEGYAIGEELLRPAAVVVGAHE
jgi:molecular chaperone GrpE